MQSYRLASERENALSNYRKASSREALYSWMHRKNLAFLGACFRAFLWSPKGLASKLLHVGHGHCRSTDLYPYAGTSTVLGYSPAKAFFCLQLFRACFHSLQSLFSHVWQGTLTSGGHHVWCSPNRFPVTSSWIINF